MASSTSTSQAATPGRKPLSTNARASPESTGPHNGPNSPSSPSPLLSPSPPRAHFKTSITSVRPSIISAGSNVSSTKRGSLQVDGSMLELMTICSMSIFGGMDKVKMGGRGENWRACGGEILMPRLIHGWRSRLLLDLRYIEGEVCGIVSRLSSFNISITTKH
jgi:hypothetical protein